MIEEWALIRMSHYSTQVEDFDIKQRNMNKFTPLKVVGDLGIWLDNELGLP